jgi:ligand-binding sensor domain-containing protein
LLLLFALWHTADLFGQSYSFRHYQVENGLSNNAVICSLQDTAGFLWFGTKDGLNRFDGYNFKVFRNNPDDTGSLGSNFILTLYEDKAHVLWVGTDNGLYQYNALSESFRLLRTTAGFTISEIITDKEGNPWFINGLTLYRYNRRTASLTTFSPECFFESTGICTTPAGDLYVSTSNGLLKKYNPETGYLPPMIYLLVLKNQPLNGLRKYIILETGLSSPAPVTPA